MLLLRRKGHLPLPGPPENLLVLGDSASTASGDPLYEAFVCTGLWPPKEVDTVPRALFDNDKTGHFFDQITWICEPDKTSMFKPSPTTAGQGTSASSPTSTPG